jgi:hypothetical protein
VWLKNRQKLRSRITDREQSTRGKSRYLKGTRSAVLRLLSDDNPKKIEYEIVLVQPGIPIGAITEKIGNILGAASDHVSRASSAKMLSIGSFRIGIGLSDHPANPEEVTLTSGACFGSCSSGLEKQLAIFPAHIFPTALCP